MPLRSYKELKVWQKSIDLVDDVYRLTRDFPKSETYGLSSQMQRAAVSVAANIAEGSGRDSTIRNSSITWLFRLARWQRSRPT